MQANRESEFALELRHVNHHYGSKQILFDMNLQLPPDRIYGLLGRNGAGKTYKPYKRADISVVRGARQVGRRTQYAFTWTSADIRPHGV